MSAGVPDKGRMRKWRLSAVQLPVLATRCNTPTIPLPCLHPVHAEPALTQMVVFVDGQEHFIHLSQQPDASNHA